jgi:2-succinyl-6-hydroxy-2,4-cyclohexadiene-1-carboxylate synthase
VLLNGLEVHVEVAGSGPPLLLLHGFSGSARSFDAVRPALAERAQVISLDLVGHGRTVAPEQAERYSFDWITRDLAALLDQLGIEQVDVLGYSMGGRVALHFAVHHPRRVDRLLVESASPGIEADAERQARVASDAALADRIERLGIAAFVDEWQAQPLLALGPQVPAALVEAQRAERLRNSAAGLANSLRGMGAGQQTPLWSSLASLDLPVQVVVGQRDTRYCQIGERMHSLLPNSLLCIVAGAGHTVHLDQPARFAHSVATVLDKKLTHRASRC